MKATAAPTQTTGDCWRAGVRGDVGGAEKPLQTEVKWPVSDERRAVDPQSWAIRKKTHEGRQREGGGGRRWGEPWCTRGRRWAATCRAPIEDGV